MALLTIKHKYFLQQNTKPVLPKAVSFSSYQLLYCGDHSFTISLSDSNLRISKVDGNKQKHHIHMHTNKLTCGYPFCPFCHTALPCEGLPASLTRGPCRQGLMPCGQAMWPHNSSLWWLFCFIFFPATFFTILALLVVILPICDVLCILTLPHEWQIFTLRSGVLLLDLFWVSPYFLFWVALETESSSKSSSLKPQNWGLEGTIASPFCDTPTMEALRIPPHNDQFSYQFHMTCADGTASSFCRDRQRVQKIIW